MASFRGNPERGPVPISVEGEKSRMTEQRFDLGSVLVSDRVEELRSKCSGVNPDASASTAPVGEAAAMVGVSETLQSDENRCWQGAGMGGK